jgi:hypothetical protein
LGEIRHNFSCSPQYNSLWGIQNVAMRVFKTTNFFVIVTHGNIVIASKFCEYVWKSPHPDGGQVQALPLPAQGHHPISSTSGNVR